MRSPAVFVIILALAIATTFCTAVDKSSDGNDGQNGILSLSVPRLLNTFKINDYVRVVVQNNSEHEIALNQDGISLLQKNGDDWTEIQNTLNVRNLVLSSRDRENYNLTEIVISPKVTKSDYAVIIKITITGVDLVTNENVQGYVEVTLTP